MSEQQEKNKQGVPDFGGLFSAGDEITGEQLLDRQNTSDKDLPLKTEIRDPMVIVAMKMLAYGAQKKGYYKIEGLLNTAVDTFLEAMVSYKRQGRKEFKETWVALMETNMRKKEGLADQLFGGSRR